MTNQKQKTKYNHEPIEKKWVDEWYKNNIYKAEDFSPKPKKYVLAEFPYPSGSKLHVGHAMRYTVPDIYGRKLRMSGFNVLFPMGWDAFGLPAENNAVKTGIHPAITTEEAIKTYKSQIKLMGFGIDWDREISTIDPKYYKWTQWLFLKFYENGLAELKEEPVWWSEELRTVLANEEVVQKEDGRYYPAERGKDPVERKMLKQWVLKMPQYADKLIDGLAKTDLQQSVKTAQINWIGRSEGAEIDFPILPNGNVTVRSKSVVNQILPYNKDLLEQAKINRKTMTKQEIAVWSAIKDNNIQGVDFHRKKVIENYIVDFYSPEIKLAIEIDGDHHDENFEDDTLRQKAIEKYEVSFLRFRNSDVDTNLEAVIGSINEKVIELKNPSVASGDSFPKEAYPSLREGDPKGSVGVSESNNNKIRIFTTRLDTIFGATFLVLAPEHELVNEITTKEQKEAVTRYIEEAKQKSELDRLSETKNKTGVFTGAYAINPFSGKQIPIWISDFVLTTYGTGAIMGVPAHDERDNEFAKKFDLEIIPVIKPTTDIIQSDANESPYTDHEGILINSSEFDGLKIDEAFEKMISRAEAEKFGERKVHYKIRDWLFSRQRYWGEPIPLIHKEDGTVEAIADTNDPQSVKNNLPLELPEVPDYTPSADGYSPLAKNEAWVNTKAKDGSPAKRETNTMPNWAGSSWYYLRYIDPQNDETFADMEKMKYWLPVDRYFGGSEHTTLHLLYSRFWHKFFYDQGLVPTEEPYQWRMNGGLLLGPDGQKMSKSIGNVINPDEKIELYGADALRLYIAFMGPYDGTIAWQEGGLKACRRLVEEIIDLKEKVIFPGNVIPVSTKANTGIYSNEDLSTAYHKMIKNVTEMIDGLRMNTAVSEFMIFVNHAKKSESINIEIWKGFIKAIAPFAPFIAEELWQEVNAQSEFKSENSVHLQPWPEYDEKLTISDSVIIGIQINGKLRSEINVNIDENEDSVKDRVLAIPEVQKWLEGNQVRKFIYVKGKIVNIVV